MHKTIAAATFVTAITIASSAFAGCGIHQGGNECDPIDSRPTVRWRGSNPPMAHPHRGTVVMPFTATRGRQCRWVVVPRVGAFCV